MEELQYQVATLLAEVAVLRAENAEIAALRFENAELKSQVAELQLELTRR